MHVFELFIQSDMKKSDSKKSSQRINGSNIVINGRSYVINGKILVPFGVVRGEEMRE